MTHVRSRVKHSTTEPLRSLVGEGGAGGGGGGGGYMTIQTFSRFIES